jgi:hypothetical protein
MASTADEQPLWDRHADIVWTRHIPSGGKEVLDDGTAFRANLESLALKTPIPSQRSQAPNDEVSLTQTEMANGSLAIPSHKVPEKRSQNANSRYFQLPDRVRFEIMRHVLANHSPDNKPIRMNNPVFLWEAWPVNRHRKPKVWSTDYFDSLESVLSSLDSYTSVCAAMRADILAALFLIRRFHVVYSPFVGRESQPAAKKYMDQYGPLMASITLEVDFTKLGGGRSPDAASLNPTSALKQIIKLVEGFVQSQLSRKTSIQDLRVLVRRHYGTRPALDDMATQHGTQARNNQPHKPTTIPSQGPTAAAAAASLRKQHPPSYSLGNKETLTPFPLRYLETTTKLADTSTPHTPNPHITQTLDPLKSLGPLVARLTLTGAPEDFAAQLIASLWGNSKALLRSDTGELAEHVVWRVPGREYPLFPGSWAGTGSQFGTGALEGVGDSGGVGCGPFDEKGGEEWEGEYGCRLLVDGGEGGVNRKKGMSRGVRGVLALPLRSGAEAKAGGFVAGEGIEKEHEGKEKKKGDEDLEEAEEAEEAGSGVSKLAQGLFRRIAGGRKRGLFGQY